MKHLCKSLITLLLFVANTCAYAGQTIGTKDTIVIVTNNNDDSCMSHLLINKGSVRDTLISIYCADGSEIEPLKEVNSKNKQTQKRSSLMQKTADRSNSHTSENNSVTEHYFIVTYLKIR